MGFCFCFPLRRLYALNCGDGGVMFWYEFLCVLYAIITKFFSSYLPFCNPHTGICKNGDAAPNRHRGKPIFNYPANTKRDKHVIITSKRSFDVIITCLSRCVLPGYYLSGDTTTRLVSVTTWLVVPTNNTSVMISRSIDRFLIACGQQGSCHWQACTTATRAMFCFLCGW